VIAAPHSLVIASTARRGGTCGATRHQGTSLTFGASQAHSLTSAVCTVVWTACERPIAGNSRVLRRNSAADVLALPWRLVDKLVELARLVSGVETSGF